MKIKVLYEDSNILAIDKPSGIAVHPDGRSTEPTIADWVLKEYPRMKKVGEPEGGVPRPGIVHRLDKDTSGVLLLCKNQKTYEFIKEQFQNRKIRKLYNAVVSGWPKNDKGLVNKPIGRSPSDFRRYLSGRGARGELREAVTEYKVLRRWSERGNKWSYLEISPKTGRTHQIRVHMKYLSFPIGGDTLYNPGKPSPAGFKRLALHAKSIEFKDMKGKVVKIESPLPLIFKKVLK